MMADACMHCKNSIQSRFIICRVNTSPATGLHVEANEMPIALRRRRLVSQYSRVGLKIEIHKIHQNLRNPVFINRPIVSGTCY